MYRTYAALPAALQSGQELLPAAVPMLSESAIDGVEDVETERAIGHTDSGYKGKAAAMTTIRATPSRFNLPGRQAEIWSLTKTVKMEKMRMSNTEREEVFKDITRQASREQTIVANARSGYRMPPEYITRKTLVQIDLACTVICSEAQEDPRYFLNRFQGDSINLTMNLTFATGFSWWLKSSSLLYCVTEELAKALIETDILDKKNILTDLTWPFPQIVVAIPRFLLCPPGTTGVYVDFLLVNCFKKPGKETQWISICFVDTSGNIWVADTQIDADGDVTIDHGKLDEKDREFCDKIRSFAINILLLLETSGGSLFSDVVPSETVDDVKKPKGFGKKSLTPPPKYPRWIGKNYQIKSEQPPVSESRGTHASPRIHWRRGHWRCIEPGEGKKWKESKRLWIEPVLINAGIE